MRRAKDGELEAAASGPAPQDGSRARRKAKLSFQFMSWEEKLAPRFNFLSVDSFSSLSSKQCYHSCYPLSPRKGHLKVPSTRPSPSRTGVQEPPTWQEGPLMGPLSIHRLLKCHIQDSCNRSVLIVCNFLSAPSHYWHQFLKSCLGRFSVPSHCAA